MKEKILLVDDDLSLLDFFRDELSLVIDISTAQNGKQGLKLIKENLKDPFPVIVSDFDMPGMNGIQFLSEAKVIVPNSVRIMLTANTDIKTAVNAVSEGNIFRFLLKPCSPKELLKNLLAGIEQYKLIYSEKNLLEKTLLGTIGMLIDILSLTNPEVFAQSLRLRTLAKNIIKRMNLTNSWELEIGVLFSQIGCVSIPQEIIRKKSDGYELTEEEKNLYYSHPLSGYKFLSRIPRLEKVAEGIKYQYKNPETLDPVVLQMISLIKLLKDFDNLTQKNINPVQAFEILYKSMAKYDNEFLDALQAEILKVKEGYTIKIISIPELKIGDVLAEDIQSEKGLSLIRKDSEVTEVLLERLSQFRKRESIREPLKIIELVKNDSVDDDDLLL